jgi:hypothetical protein
MLRPTEMEESALRAAVPADMIAHPHTGPHNGESSCVVPCVCFMKEIHLSTAHRTSLVAEHRTCNAKVIGSIPMFGFWKFSGRRE